MGDFEAMLFCLPGSLSRCYCGGLRVFLQAIEASENIEGTSSLLVRHILTPTNYQIVSIGHFSKLNDMKIKFVLRLYYGS